MIGPKILVLNFEAASDEATTLQVILEEFLPLRASIRHMVLPRASYDGGLPPSDFDPDLIFISLAAGAFKTTTEIISRVRLSAPKLPVIVLGEVDHPDAMLDLLKVGAVDFITPPLKPVEIVSRVRRLLEVEAESPTTNIKAALGLRMLVGQNQSFVSEISKIPVIARCDATVLITGDTGTGKELCARAIHYLSPRAKRPFVPINCGAIPADLAENELFGHERGAFTGATSSQTGMIEEANSGTVFLDEIDCLSHLTQVKLLRFLQEKEYRPLGSARVRHADVRIIAATNANVEQLVTQGSLRRDLFYRLNIIPLTLIPLRERPDDIPLLAQHFLSMQVGALKSSVREISPSALQKLMLHDWPGNVRELEHVIERAVVMCQGTVLSNDDITLSTFQQPSSPCSFQEGKAKVVHQFELNYIKALLIAYRGNISKAARAANKNRRAFWELIRKHGIDASSFKRQL
jgi:two-component system, NtrC family, response regulator GlrR